MRTPSKSTLPLEPIGTALGTARGVALTARDKGLELLDSDAAQELLRRGHHVAIVARDRGADLLDSDAAQELVRRSRDVMSAAKGDLVAAPTKSRKPLGMLLFLAGTAAGVAAAVVGKRMSTDPTMSIPPYDDPSAQFPKKGGVVDLTSVAAEEGVGTDPAAALSSLADAEIGATTKTTRPTRASAAAKAGAGASAGTGTSNGARTGAAAAPRASSTAPVDDATGSTPTP